MPGRIPPPARRGEPICRLRKAPAADRGGGRRRADRRGAPGRRAPVGRARAPPHPRRGLGGATRVRRRTSTHGGCRASRPGGARGSDGEPRLAAETPPVTASRRHPRHIDEPLGTGRVPPPGDRAPPGVQEALPAAHGERVGVAHRVGPRRPLPSDLCAGGRRDRSVGLRRRRCTADPPSTADGGARRPGVAARRGRRRAARTAGARCDVRRRRPRGRRARGGSVRRHRRRRRGAEPGGGQGRDARRDVRRDDGRERAPGSPAATDVPPRDGAGGRCRSYRRAGRGRVDLARSHFAPAVRAVAGCTVSSGRRRGVGSG